MPFPRFRLAACVAAALLAAPAVAAAQATAPDTAIPEVPAPARPGGDADPCAGQPGVADGGQTLTGQLSQCGGVLTPPSTGTEDGNRAQVPDPDPNTTPVVPPEAVPDQAPNGSEGSGQSPGGNG